MLSVRLGIKLRILPPALQNLSGPAAVSCAAAAPQPSQGKSQGPDITGEDVMPVTGSQVAENPRNDVPPVSPEAREGNSDVPPSPDSTFADANHHRYASPGAHVGRAGRDGEPAKDARPDMGNAAKPLLHQEKAGQAQRRQAGKAADGGS